MKVRILGTAAGGGLPQWNCGCEGCTTARRTGTGRSQDCLAISGDGVAWYTVNASPDLRAQLLATPELAPVPGSRDTPLRGVLLTSAELDHVLGLLTLREAGSLSVYAAPPVLAALHSAFPVGPVLAPYTKVTWNRVEAGAPIHLDGGLSATAVPLGSKRPRFAADLAAGDLAAGDLAAGDVAAGDLATGDLDGRDDWTVAYRFTDAASGRTLLYAPCLPAWTGSFDAAVEGADVVLLDGTFQDDGEMSRGSGGQRTSRGMGHLAVDDSLPLVARRRGPRYFYTHLNNTNPLAHPGEAGHARLAASGARVAGDGLLLDL